MYTKTAYNQSDTVGQIRSDTVGYGQIRSDTVRYGQIRADTGGYGWIRADTVGYGQLRADTVRYGWKRSDAVRYGRMRSDTVRLRSVTVGYGTATVRLRLSARIGRITVNKVYRYCLTKKFNFSDQFSIKSL